MDPIPRILVPGATGKVGSRLARRLAQRGDQVRALVRDPALAADLREAVKRRGPPLDDTGS